MAEFNNVSIAKAANVYFDGHVTSRSITFDDGTKKTLGIMLPGTYEFNTASKEIMEIACGDFEVKLPLGEWVSYTAPATFEVPANSKFEIKVNTLIDYCCSFVK